MSDTVFIAYEPEDAPRAAAIVQALRAAGMEVHGDARGAAPPETVAEALRQAWVVLVLWSDASPDRKEGRHVLAEARAAAERGAYMGVTIDKVAPPFGFTGFQLVDLSRWGGGRDHRLAGLVEDVRKRMDRLPAGPIANRDAPAKAKAG